MGIKLKLTGLRRFVRTEAEIADYTAQVAAAQDTLVNGTGAGNDFLGWLNLPVDYDRDEFARIKQAAKKIQQRATRPLLCRITSAAVSRCSRRSVCCRWLQPVWILTR